MLYLLTLPPLTLPSPYPPLPFPSPPQGWRSSWEMLYTYGFVPGASTTEWIAAGGRPMFFDGVTDDDPLMPQKRALLVALGADENAYAGTWLDLKARKDSCVAMAPLLRLAKLAQVSRQRGTERAAFAYPPRSPCSPHEGTSAALPPSLLA